MAVGSDFGAFDTRDWQLVRLTDDGSIDPTFGNQGRVSLDWFTSADEALSVALAADGSIVAGGSAFDPNAGNAFATAVFDSSGALVWQRADKLFNNTADFCVKVLIQPDGKIVCVGRARNFGGAAMGAFRYNPDASPDMAFGTDGRVSIDFGDEAEAQTAWLMDSGEILLAGYVERDGGNDWALALAQLTSDGALDAGFGTNGLAEFNLASESTESISDLQVVNGTIYAAVRVSTAADFVLAAFDSSGAIDANFGSGGLAQLDFNGGFDLNLSLDLQQGHLLAAGSAASPLASGQRDLALARYGLDGTLDVSFGDNGRAQAALSGPANITVTAAARRPTGGSIVVGFLGSTFGGRELLAAAFDASGALDPSFADQGILILDLENNLDQADDVAVLADGRVVIAGTSRTQSGTEDITALRLLSDGSLDLGFGDQGRTIIDVDGGNDAARSVLIQPDGKIVVLGDATFTSEGSIRNYVLVRLEADGSLDSAFGTGGLASLNVERFDFGYTVARQAGGELLIGGLSNRDFLVARFLSDGTLDASFGTGGVAQIDFLGQLDFAQQLLVIDDWMGMGPRIFVAGSARTSSSVTSEDFAAVLLDNEGNLETGFADSGRFVQAVAVDRGDLVTSAVHFRDRLILAGRARSEEFTYDMALLALQMDGQVDPAFFSNGAPLLFDLAGADDELFDLAVDGEGLLATGHAFDPEVGVRQIALLRFAVSSRLFKNGFEAP